VAAIVILCSSKSTLYLKKEKEVTYGPIKNKTISNNSIQCLTGGLFALSSGYKIHAMSKKVLWRGWLEAATFQGAEDEGSTKQVYVKSRKSSVLRNQHLARSNRNNNHNYTQAHETIKWHCSYSYGCDLSITTFKQGSSRSNVICLNKSLLLHSISSMATHISQKYTLLSQIQQQKHK
jgi:hypothetical protein